MKSFIRFLLALGLSNGLSAAAPVADSDAARRANLVILDASAVKNLGITTVKAGPADFEDDDGGFESTDTEPVDYDRGPHDEEFGVFGDEFESPDADPIDYGKGPHDYQFGVDDDDDRDGDHDETP